MDKKGVIFATLAVLTVNAFAQTAFKYLTDSLAVLRYWRDHDIVEITDFEYNGENALWGAFLEPGKSVSQNLRFDAGVEYLMLAAADTTRTEIHLKVYQGQGAGGTVITKDRAYNAMPIARFKPSESGWHCFELINASDKPAFVSMIILKQKKNANFSLAALNEANIKFSSLSPYLASLFPKSGITANKWTLFGGSIREGSAAGLLNVQLPRATMANNYALVGVGENSLNDCDVEIIEQYAADNQDGRKNAQNTNSRFPYDYMVFSPNTPKHHYLKVINKSSRGESAFMFGFLVSAQ